MQTDKKKELLMTIATKEPEIIFIEYRLSNMPLCKSPLEKSPSLERYLVSITEDLMKAMDASCATYTVMYWTEKHIADNYKGLSLRQLGKASKLFFLKKLKEHNKPIIVFTTLEIIKSVVTTLQDDLPREIICKGYFCSDPEYPKYYLSFYGDISAGDEVLSFYFENAPMFSSTALMKA